jgi:GNAT superfamily N-acetyltransferase
MIDYLHWEGPIGEAAGHLLALCRAAFDGFDDSYLLDRLPRLTDPDLWIAEREGEWVGFKLGYRRGPDLLYSWLGGVAPSARRLGIASALMERQHAGVLAQGYRFVETRTRAANNAMVIVNLHHGFHIAGFEIDARGIAVVIQRKVLVGAGS